MLQLKNIVSEDGILRSGIPQKLLVGDPEEFEGSLIDYIFKKATETGAANPKKFIYGNAEKGRQTIAALRRN